MNNPSLKKKPWHNYAKYSGMSLQMVAIIFLGTWGGFKLDKLIDWRFPILTVLLSFLAVSLAVYLFIREFF